MKIEEMSKGLLEETKECKSLEEKRKFLEKYQIELPETTPICFAIHHNPVTGDFVFRDRRMI